MSTTAQKRFRRATGLPARHRRGVEAFGLRNWEAILRAAEGGWFEEARTRVYGDHFGDVFDWVEGAREKGSLPEKISRAFGERLADLLGGDARRLGEKLRYVGWRTERDPTTRRLFESAILDSPFWESCRRGQPAPLEDAYVTLSWSPVPGAVAYSVRCLP